MSQLTVVQQNYVTLSQAKGFEEYVKLFEIAGHDPEQAKSLAEKEAWHLSQLMTDSQDLAQANPSSLLMELRKIPLQGVSLDPALKLAYLIVQDKSKGVVRLEITGRGKAVQAIAQNIIKNLDCAIIYEGDTTQMGSDNLLRVIPAFKDKAKVTGGILTITWPDGSKTQEIYRQSHIDSWQSRSAKRNGSRGANMNYTSFNGGMEPGFLASKMLKHKLDRIGINPIPVRTARIAEIANKVPDINEPTHIEVIEAEEIPNETAPGAVNPECL